MGHQEGGQPIIYLLVQVLTVHNGVMGVPKLGGCVGGIGAQVYPHGPLSQPHLDADVHRVRLHGVGVRTGKEGVSDGDPLEEGHQIATQFLGNILLGDVTVIGLPAVPIVGADGAYLEGVGGVHHGFGAEECGGGYGYQGHQHRCNWKHTFPVFHGMSLLS